MLKNDFVQLVSRWFVEANQMPEEPTPNVRQAAFYLGMQLEELAEKLEAVFGKNTTNLTMELNVQAEMFKNGELDVLVGERMKFRSGDLLDGDVDLLWVTIGAARAQGANIPLAAERVVEANYKKRWSDGVFHNDPRTGKVLKPEGWTAPDLSDCVHPSLRSAA